MKIVGNFLLALFLLSNNSLQAAPTTYPHPILILENYALQETKDLSVELKDTFPEKDTLPSQRPLKVLYILENMVPDGYEHREFLSLEKQYFNSERSTVANTFVVVKDIKDELRLIRWSWLNEDSLKKVHKAKGPFVNSSPLLSQLIQKIPTTVYPETFATLQGYTVLKFKKPLVVKVRDDFEDPEFKGSLQTIPFAFVALKNGFGASTNFDEFLTPTIDHFEKPRRPPTRDDFMNLDLTRPQYVYVQGAQRRIALINSRWLTKVDFSNLFEIRPFAQQVALLRKFRNKATPDLRAPQDWLDKLCAENKKECQSSRDQALVDELSGCSREGKGYFECRDELRASWLTCEKDSDCTGVPSDCGHWIPINTLSKIKHMRLIANRSGMHCRWEAPSYRKYPMPTYKCLEKSCRE